MNKLSRARLSPKRSPPPPDPQSGPTSTPIWTPDQAQNWTADQAQSDPRSTKVMRFRTAAIPHVLVAGAQDARGLQQEQRLHDQDLGHGAQTACAIIAAPVVCPRHAGERALDHFASRRRKPKDDGPRKGVAGHSQPNGTRAVAELRLQRQRSGKGAVRRPTAATTDNKPMQKRQKSANASSEVAKAPRRKTPSERQHVRLRSEPSGTPQRISITAPPARRPLPSAPTGPRLVARKPRRGAALAHNRSCTNGLR